MRTVRCDHRIVRKWLDLNKPEEIPERCWVPGGPQGGITRIKRQGNFVSFEVNGSLGGRWRITMGVDELQKLFDAKEA